MEINKNVFTLIEVDILLYSNDVNIIKPILGAMFASFNDVLEKQELSQSYDTKKELLGTFEKCYQIFYKNDVDDNCSIIENLSFQSCKINFKKNFQELVKQFNKFMGVDKTFLIFNKLELHNEDIWNNNSKFINKYFDNIDGLKLSVQ